MILERGVIMHRSLRSKQLGDEGELAVASWLQQHGYAVCERNYQDRYGEIDLIVRKDDIIAFVEVKSRRDDYFDLSEVVNLTKQRKISKTARAYIVKSGVIQVAFAYRFDVALVKKENDGFKISYIEDAFNSEVD